MANIVIQELDKNGVASVVTWQAADAGGDVIVGNTGNVIFMVRGAAGWTDEVASVEGVPAQDSGRDGAESYAPAAVGAVAVGGPFKSRNFNNASGGINVSYTGTAPATGLQVAAVRYTSG